MSERISPLLKPASSGTRACCPWSKTFDELVGQDVAVDRAERAEARGGGGVGELVAASIARSAARSAALKLLAEEIPALLGRRRAVHRGFFSSGVEIM